MLGRVTSEANLIFDINEIWSLIHLRSLKVEAADPTNKTSSAITNNLPSGLEEICDSENAESLTTSVTLVTPPESAIPESKLGTPPEPKLSFTSGSSLVEAVGVGLGTGSLLINFEIRIAEADNSPGAERTREANTHFLGPL